MSNLSIYREEHDYADIKGIGIRENGELVIVKNGENVPFLSATTRVVKNVKVDNAFSAPIKLFLDPTTKCPLSCPFCLSDSSFNSNLSINKEIISNIVQDTIDMGVLKVKIGGGEPFIYPYFEDIIEKLRKAGVYVSCSTSGITANKKTVEDLKFFARNNVKVSISIDGDEHYHDKLRNHEGLFQKAIVATHKLKQAGVNVELRATISNNLSSYKQINYLSDLSKDLNLKLRIRTVKPKGRAVRNNHTTIYPDENYWTFFDNIRDLAQNNSLINIEEMLAYDGDTAYSCYDRKLDCAAGTRSAYVDASGHFCPCGFIEQYFPSEALKQDIGMKELWSKGDSFLKMRKFFQEINSTSKCAKCDYANSCQGGCPSVRLAAGSNMDCRCPKDRKVYQCEITNRKVA